jgi:hypothetical protein
MLYFVKNLLVHLPDFGKIEKKEEEEYQEGEGKEKNFMNKMVF